MLTELKTLIITKQMARPRTREKQLDTNYSMRVSHEDRDRFMRAAELLGMSLNAFTNSAINTVCDLIEADEKKLPHSKELEVVKVGQFLKKSKKGAGKKYGHTYINDRIARTGGVFTESTAYLNESLLKYVLVTAVGKNHLLEAMPKSG